MKKGKERKERRKWLGRFHGRLANFATRGRSTSIVYSVQSRGKDVYFTKDDVYIFL